MEKTNKQNIKEGDKFIWRHQGTAFVLIAKKINKNTIFDGSSYIKHRDVIKWTPKKQKIVDEVYKYQDIIMDLLSQLNTEVRNSSQH